MPTGHDEAEAAEGAARKKRRSARILSAKKKARAKGPTGHSRDASKKQAPGRKKLPHVLNGQRKSDSAVRKAVVRTERDRRAAFKSVCAAVRAARYGDAKSDFLNWLRLRLEGDDVTGGNWLAVLEGEVDRLRSALYVAGLADGDDWV